MGRQFWLSQTLVLAAILTLGFVTAASADVATMDDFAVTLNGTTIFNDNFSAGQTLAGGDPPGAVVPSGRSFSNGTPASYQVTGTVTETGNKAVLDSARGGSLFLPPPFFGNISLNSADLLTGPPTVGGVSNPLSLTPNDVFSTTALFDLTVPPTTNAFYQVELSENGEVLSVGVQNCTPAACGGISGPAVDMGAVNLGGGTGNPIAGNPLDAGNQQILLELSHPTAGIPDVFGSYAYVNGGVAGSPTTLGDFTGLFDTLAFAQAGFAQVTPTPEPSSLTLLASSLPSALGLMWLRRRAAGCRFKKKTRA